MRIIAGDAKGRKIEAPSGLQTRPTLDRVRENLFNMLQGSVSGANVLDLFAGSGALSLEAVSRGAANAVMVDHDRRAIEVQRRNIETLRYSGRTVQYHCDWEKAVSLLENEKQFFDLVFLDPPYSFQETGKVFMALKPLLAADAVIVLEHASKEERPVPAGYILVKERSWGYCAVSVYRNEPEGSEKD